MEQTPDTAHSSATGSAGRIAAIVILIAAIALALFTSQIKFTFSSDPLGPRTFPYLLSALIALCAVWYWLAPGANEDSPGSIALKKIAIFLGLICLSVVAMTTLGFVPAMTVLCAGLARLFGATWRQAVVSGVLQAVGWWLVFGVVMGSNLPRGPLGF